MFGFISTVILRGQPEKTRTTSTYCHTQGTLVLVVGRQILTGVVCQPVAWGRGQLGSAPAMGWAVGVSYTEVLARARK